MKRNAHGFTIVELLIVIVVIAILAALSSMTYGGIQDRARLSAVHSDLSNAKKQLMVLQVESGSYPKNGAELTAAKLSVSGVGNYDIRPSYSNYYYCADIAGAEFAIGARVASTGASYYISSSSGIQSHAGLISQNLTCAKIGLTGSGAAEGAYSASGMSTVGVLSTWLSS